ncbi:hypothetical protein PP175_25815 (plasmid) [Aneurinibacillus sp. Ricciae_BoGa-3]|uniref:hypothetical protein n=1 Tax=Aneurinibacillus sp. Ricciae_BoGa-3 TaxID=3022697 RepID=UPI0023406976|nr:hypothetical protein [Aneurinibacillus sp. Ricciae_BoGa-3]WCK57486.1 hypothetical protein PP175_25815 [Aneurinibacillus sp. Ricciae_BoGa-3]
MLKGEFDRLTTLFVRHITPKSSENVDKTIEFVVDMGGEEFILRAFAPSNYRQVWVKIPKERLKEILDKNDWWKNNMMNGWLKTADHDSGWTEGFDLSRIVGWYRELTLKQINIGTLPKTKELGGNFYVDQNKGEHLADTLTESISTDNHSLAEIYILFVVRVYQDGDQLSLIFDRTDGKKTRKIQVVDKTTLKRLSTPRDKISEKEASLNADGLVSLLGKGEWTLFNVSHRREDTHFF